MARVAVASSDGVNINGHFGTTREFIIYDVAEDGRYEQQEIRSIPQFCSGGDSAPDHHSDRALEQLADVEAVLVEQIGPGAVRTLEAKGIRAFTPKGSIDKALTSYGKRSKLLGKVPLGGSAGSCGCGCGGGNGRGGCR